jgi:hypothetical protein
MEGLSFLGVGGHQDLAIGVLIGRRGDLPKGWPAGTNLWGKFKMLPEVHTQ